MAEVNAPVLDVAFRLRGKLHHLVIYFHWTIESSVKVSKQDNYAKDCLAFRLRGKFHHLVIFFYWTLEASVEA